jgi:predicted RNase H-like HicB family nuclease
MALRHYYALIEPLDEGRGYSIWFPSFPGTTSHAESPQDVHTQAVDALATVVEAMEADGEALPRSFEAQDGGVTFDAGFFKTGTAMLVPVETSGKALRVNISLNEGLLSRLHAVARRTGTSRSALLARGAKLVIATESGS